MVFCREVVAGMNPMDLKRGIDAAVKLVLEDMQIDAKGHVRAQTCTQTWQELENISKPISKPAEIQQAVCSFFRFEVFACLLLEGRAEPFRSPQFRRTVMLALARWWRMRLRGWGSKARLQWLRRDGKTLRIV